MTAITLTAVAFFAALAICIAVATGLHRRSLSPTRQFEALEARNLRQRQQLAPAKPLPSALPLALPPLSTRHTALDGAAPPAALPWERTTAPARRTKPAHAPMNDRIRQRIARCATARAHEDHFNGITTPCPLTGDDEAAAIWSRAYAVALQRIADLRELHNVPPTPAARPTAHVQRAEAELFGRQYAPTDLAPA